MLAEHRQGIGHDRCALRQEPAATEHAGGRSRPRLVVEDDGEAGVQEGMQDPRAFDVAGAVGGTAAPDVDDGRVGPGTGGSQEVADEREVSTLEADLLGRGRRRGVRGVLCV